MEKAFESPFDGIVPFMGRRRSAGSEDSAALASLPCPPPPALLRARSARAWAAVLASAGAAFSAPAVSAPRVGWPVPAKTLAAAAPTPSAAPMVARRAASSAASARCTKNAAGALAELGCELAAGLGALDGPVIVAAAPVVGDVPVARSGDLSTRFAALVAKPLGARALAGALSLSEARSAAPEAKLVVVVGATLAHGQARAFAVAYPAALGFWDRLRAAQSSPVAEASASRRVDGEIAAFLPKIALAPAPAERVAGGTDAIALACGDITGSGEAELVLVGRRKLSLGRAEKGRLVTRAELDWTALSPIAPSPLREPLASVTIRPGHAVDVGISDRASGVELSPALALVGKLDAPLPWPSVGCLSRIGVGVGAPKPCRRGEPPDLELGDVGEVDVFATGTSVDGSGKRALTVAFRNPRTREVTLRDDMGRTAALGVAGGALALADMDLDGEPEIVTSLDTDDPASDAVVVSTWAHDGAVRERARIAVKDGVRALAVCPVAELHVASIVVGTGSGLWILR
jgi:hypothetical protein